MKMRRFFSILLSAAMMVTLIPAIAPSAVAAAHTGTYDDTDSYPVYVGVPFTFTPSAPIDTWTWTTSTFVTPVADVVASVSPSNPNLTVAASGITGAVTGKATADGATGTVTVTATDSDGTPNTATQTFTITAEKGVLGGTLGISNAIGAITTTTANPPKVGDTLTPSIPNLTSQTYTITPADANITYTWSIGGVPVVGPTYIVQPADAGKTLTLSATASSCTGSLTASSYTIAVGGVTYSSTTITVGNTVTATLGTGITGTYTWQGRLSGASGGGAYTPNGAGHNSLSYTPNASDFGNDIRLVVTSGGSTVAEGAWTQVGVSVTALSIGGNGVVDISISNGISTSTGSLGAWPSTVIYAMSVINLSVTRVVATDAITWQANVTGGIFSPGVFDADPRVVKVNYTPPSGFRPSGPIIITANMANDQAVANAIYNWIQWNGSAGQLSVRGNNAINPSGGRYQVTGNLNLAASVPAANRYLNPNGTGSGTQNSTYTLDTNGFSIRWETSSWNPGNTGANITTNGSNIGLVTFPASNQNANVTLTARVYRGETLLSNTNTGVNTGFRSFDLTITQPTADQLAINAAMNWLVWNEIRLGNEANSSATGPYVTFADLELVTSYTYKPTNNAADEKKVTITWSQTRGSSGIVTTSGTNMGRVTPPSGSTAQNPAGVTLTAVFTCGAITSTTVSDNPNSKKFDLDVRQPSDAEAVRAVRTELTWETIKGTNTDQNGVMTNLTLLTAGNYGTAIMWTSSNPAVISNTGVVTMPLTGSAAVTLTATITKGGASERKDITVTVGVPQPKVENTPSGSSWTLSVDAFKKMSENGTKPVIVNTLSGTISFNPAAALAICNSAVTGDVVVTIERVTSGLPFDLANRPVYDLKVLAGGRLISNFGAGSATVELGYQLGFGEDANSVVLYHIDALNTKKVVFGYFSAGRVIFSTPHFSRFAIGYNSVIFNDMANSTMPQHVSFVGARELFKGDHAKNFNPQSNITRAEFLAVLFNFDGASLGQYTWNNFSDAQTGWYVNHIAWAQANGILGSYFEATFRPDEPITRADMSYWLYNFIQYKKIPLTKTRDLTLTDLGGLSYPVQNAIQELANGGVLSGRGGGIFGPNDYSKREEVAAMLAMFIQSLRIQ